MSGVQRSELRSLDSRSTCRDDAETGSELEMRLGEIEKAAHRAGELTKLMLAYSGRAPFSVQPVQPADLLTELGQLLDVSMSFGSSELRRDNRRARLQRQSDSWSS